MAPFLLLQFQYSYIRVRVLFEQVDDFKKRFVGKVDTRRVPAGIRHKGYTQKKRGGAQGRIIRVPVVPYWDLFSFWCRQTDVSFLIKDLLPRPATIRPRWLASAHVNA